MRCPAVLVALCLLAAMASRLSATQPPNIVIILADDLGWADSACYRADLHETPHLDRLAKRGVRFTQAYSAASICTPTRAALLTGKHPVRMGLTLWREATFETVRDQRLIPPRADSDLPTQEVTLAEQLQSAGYVTAAVGKWHLGDATGYPEVHGFDLNIGGTLWGAPATHFWPYRGTWRAGHELRYVPNLPFGKKAEYLTDRLTDEALRVIDAAAGRPFFLYLAHYAVHAPIEAPPADVQHFTARLRPELHHQNATYAAMVHRLDDSVGRVVAHLESRGLADNTLVIFTSDNGGLIGPDRLHPQQIPVTNNLPLLVAWPGVARAGTVCDQPAVTMDLFHTALAAAGQAPPTELPPDGTDLTPLLRDPQSTLAARDLCWHFPHYYPTTTPVSALRQGDWKLLEYFEDGRLELFNLSHDPGETHDLATQEPDRARQLHARLSAWRTTVGARLPQINPDRKSTAAAK